MADRQPGPIPAPGDVLLIGQAASVQFAGRSGMTFRVIRVHDRTTYDGWVWLDGYRLDKTGSAVERRSIFVQLLGLRRAAAAPQSTATPKDRRTRRATS